MNPTRLALIITLLVAAPAALADCVADTTVAEAKLDYQQGAQLEARGDAMGALRAYEAAQGYVCEDGGNPVAKAAAGKAAALAGKRGQQAEAQGHHYASDNASPGAFQWYEAGGHYAAADRSLVAALRKNPQDLALSAFAQEHFQRRGEPYFLANHQLQISAAGPYTRDKTHAEFVAGLPISNIERLLKQAAGHVPDAYLKEWAALDHRQVTAKPHDIAASIQLQQQAGQFEQTWQSNRLDDTLKLFQQANSWTQQLRDHARAEQLRERIDRARILHADRLLAGYAGVPDVMQSALDAYQASDAQAKVDATQRRAGQLADEAMKAQQYQRAARFYYLAEQYEQEQLANAQYQAEQDAMAEAMSSGYAAQAAQLRTRYSNPEQIQALQQKAMEMQKQLEQQSSGQPGFEAETDALEQELGL